jgi:hypothetical protein
MSVILTGCSAVRLGYNNLPDIASWWLDSYIDFSDTQGPQAKAALQKLQTWHRKEELPAIAELLVQAQTLAPQNITPEQACKIWEVLKCVSSPSFRRAVAWLRPWCLN